jgi:hypothetical protein
MFDDADRRRSGMEMEVWSDFRVEGCSVTKKTSVQEISPNGTYRRLIDNIPRLPEENSVMKGIGDCG